jgi:hypothetical protein
MFLFCKAAKKRKPPLFWKQYDFLFTFSTITSNKKCFFLLLSSLVMHQETRLIFAPSLIPRKLKTKTDKYFFFFTTEENSCFFFPN